MAGVPLSVPVPFLLLTNETPVGKAPVLVKVGVGVPGAVTLNEPSEPAVNVVLLALVIARPALTVSVKIWVASGTAALWAVKVRL